MGKRETEARQCLKTERKFTLLILMTKITQKLAKMREENRKDQKRLPCLVQRAPHRFAKVFSTSEIASEKKKLQKTVYGWKVESHNSTTQRLNLLNPKAMKTTLQVKDLVRHITSAQVYSGCESSSGQGMEDGNWKWSRARRRWSMKHNETKRMSILFHWWTYAT